MNVYILYLYCPFNSYNSTVKMHQRTSLEISVFIKTWGVNCIGGGRNTLIDHSDKLDAFIDFRECNFGLWDLGVWTGSNWLRIGTGGGLL